MATASGVCRGPVLQLPSSRVPHKRLLPRRAAVGAPAGNFFVKRGVAYNGRSYHHFSPLSQRGGLQAAVLPVTPILDDEEKRKQMAEDYGFTQIGEQLPDNVTLKDVMDTLPKEVFEINDVKAWTSVLISVTSYALGLFFIAKSPWLIEDTAWQPVWQREIESSPFLRKAIIFGYGPIRPWMSIAHWPNEVPRVKISLACVFAFMAIGWPLIILKTGLAGWFKFWFMPWMMSTFTMVHHTAPHIPFKSSEEWNAAQAQLNGTVHCNYPQWIEILCHDINVHVPHHISPRIPSYNLRAAYDSIKQNWGKYVNEANWNWRLMKTILTRCHVYDKDRYYVPFDELAPEESQPIKFLRKFMPDYA
ncbi:hypothetical protein U9M48_038785 [Paspalum notatum var. saurae]|uniref:Fatty acid desaturase domain-containing protein n=1 Tax=Paspalum notatum var. saurae TaxID=547442 RepID=A0AAQ3XCE1_PASNO